MSLANSLNKFRSDISTAAARNIAHSRPNNSRSGTPQPSKRTHESAFAAPPAATTTPGHAGTELLTQVFNAVKYLKEKDSKPVTFESLIGYLSLPNDAQKNIPLIKRALMQHERVEYTKSSSTGKETFKYRPLHPVTNAEELKTYLASQPTAQGIPVKELKDGWADCVPAIDLLESQGFVLVTRNKKDNSPRIVWTDNPDYHILDIVTQAPKKADADFVDVWLKTKLPPSEAEVRGELEKAGLTPTSVVKEVRNLGAQRKKERKKTTRRGGKTTNSHLLGVLRDYSRR